MPRSTATPMRSSTVLEATLVAKCPLSRAEPGPTELSPSALEGKSSCAAWVILELENRSAPFRSWK